MTKTIKTNGFWQKRLEYIENLPEENRPDTAVFCDGNVSSLQKCNWLSDIEKVNEQPHINTKG